MKVLRTIFWCFIILVVLMSIGVALNIPSQQQSKAMFESDGGAMIQLASRNAQDSYEMAL